MPWKHTMKRHLLPSPAPAVRCPLPTISGGSQGAGAQILGRFPIDRLNHPPRGDSQTVLDESLPPRDAERAAGQGRRA